MLFKRKKLDNNFDTDIPKIVVGTKQGHSQGYNRIRDNLIYYSDNGKNKVYQVESSISGEGKTTIVCNLAVSLANSGKKVVVVDLDFRRPKIHRSFSIVNLNGITEYMLGECQEAELIKKTSMGVDVINRGRESHNPSVIFTSEKFKELINKLRAEYDVVLLDCPPILLVSDYIHISKCSDAVIFVLCAGATHRSHLKESMELLKRNNANVMGLVMTYYNNGKFSLKSNYYGGRYYSSLYNKYSDK